MQIHRMPIVLIMLSMLSGCYTGISGKVIDSVTQQPIEGAVVLVQWTKTQGVGLTHHSVHKIAETETDKKGEFSLPGAYCFLVDSPNLVIYKRGYVAWRNDVEFPGYGKRKGYDVCGSMDMCTV